MFVSFYYMEVIQLKVVSQKNCLALYRLCKSISEKIRMVAMIATDQTTILEIKETIRTMPS